MHHHINLRVFKASHITCISPVNKLYQFKENKKKISKIILKKIQA
jgi:hypothetical protein